MRSVTAAFWTVFISLAAFMSYILLSACDFGRPIFRLHYCVGSGTSQASLTNAREREQSLKEAIRSAELDLTRLPICIAPSQIKFEEKSEKALTLPEEKLVDIPPSPKQPELLPQKLKIPSTLKDLKGCWQSVRGDIDMYTDDVEGKWLGRVRICLCFGQNGKGEILYLYDGPNGARCKGPLTGRIEQQRLIIRHEKLGCNNRRHIVSSQTTCRETEADSAICDIKTFGIYRSSEIKDERYQRTDNSFCEWNG